MRIHLQILCYLTDDYRETCVESWSKAYALADEAKRRDLTLREEIDIEGGYIILSDSHLLEDAQKLDELPVNELVPL